VTEEEITEPREIERAAVLVTAFDDPVGVEQEPVAGPELLGVRGDGRLTMLLSGVDLAQPQREAGTTDEFFDLLVAPDQQRRRVTAGQPGEGSWVTPSPGTRCGAWRRRSAEDMGHIVCFLRDGDRLFLT
jgi:hypothetical protein